MAFKARKFAYQYPTFGRSKAQKATEPFKNTVYYFWWEFLRRSENYRKCCESGGKGRLSRLYADFGDVFSVDFKTWWYEDERGARLFGEVVVPPFKEVTTIDPDNIPPDTFYVQVCMTISKRDLSKEFQKFLNKHHKGRVGVRNIATSTAKYPVLGHVDISALDTCLRFYDTKTNNPGMSHWEVAQECVTRAKMRIREEDYKQKGEVLLKKNILANISCRYVKKAKKLIQNVEAGKFPYGGV